MSSPNTIPQLRSEYARLHAEITEVVDAATKEKRSLTEDESRSNTEKFSQISSIQLQLTARKADELGKVREALEANDKGITFAARIPGQDEYEASIGVFSNAAPSSTFGKPIGPKELFSTAINAQPCGYGIGEFCRSMVLGPKNDRMRFALQNSSDNTGGFEIHPSATSQVIDDARSGSVFVQSGAQTVLLTNYRNRIAKIADNSAPTWRAESAPVDASLSFTGSTYSPKTLAVIVKMPRELLEDALNVDEALGNAFATEFAAELDRVCGWGSGSGEPLGIYNTPNILNVPPVNHADTLDDYTKLLQALYELQVHQAKPTAVVMSPRESKTINSFVDTLGQPLRRPDALAALQFAVAANAPETQVVNEYSDVGSMMMGDFSKLWVGIRDSMRVEILRETYATTLEYGFLGTLRVDVAVTHPKAFCSITGLIP